MDILLIIQKISLKKIEVFSFGQQNKPLNEMMVAIDKVSKIIFLEFL